MAMDGAQPRKCAALVRGVGGGGARGMGSVWLSTLGRITLSRQRSGTWLHHDERFARLRRAAHDVKDPKP